VQTRLLILLSVSLLLPSIASSQHNATKSLPTHRWFGVNLLKNGTLEAATEDNKEVPGWKSAPGFVVADYGSVGSEWDTGLSGCPTCGSRYARLQFGDAVHELFSSQTVDVAPASADIDKGTVTATVSAWLGGFQNSDTANILEVSFQDAAGKELGMIATDPVDTSKLPKAERGGTSLVLSQKSGSVPAGTRSIVFTWHGKATGASGDYLALGDNFALVLSKPQP
jgi:hypothetical protein